MKKTLFKRKSNRDKRENEAIANSFFPASPWEHFAARFLDIIIEVNILNFLFFALLDAIYGLNLNNFPVPILYPFSFFPFATEAVHTLLNEKGPPALLITCRLLFMIPLSFLLDSAIYALFGNTGGKWFIGIKTVFPHGDKVKGWTYLKRNILVFISGFGMFLPIVPIITFIIQFIKVIKKGKTTYDARLNIEVIRYKTNAIKTFLTIFFQVLLVFVPFIATVYITLMIIYLIFMLSRTGGF